MWIKNTREEKETESENFEMQAKPESTLGSSYRSTNWQTQFEPISFKIPGNQSVFSSRLQTVNLENSVYSQSQVSDLLQLVSVTEIFEKADNKYWNRSWAASLSHRFNKNLDLPFVRLQMW